MPETTKTSNYRSNVLNEDQVLDIRRRVANKSANQNQLAREYGVSRMAISYIVRRKTWAHLPEEPTPTG